MNSMSFAHVDAPFGEGATITALRAARLLMILFAGVAADQIGAVRATIITASAALLFAIVWGASTWRLWR